MEFLSVKNENKYSVRFYNTSPFLFFKRKSNQWLPACIMMVLVLAGSCARGPLSPREYISFIESPKNGLCVEKSLGEIRLLAQYKPYEYILVKESKEQNFSFQAVQHDLKQLEGYEYFTFKIGSLNSSSTVIEKNDGTQEFFARLAYCSFGMQNDFELVCGNEVLPCTLYHFERNYGLAPYNTFILGFESKKASASIEKTLIYNDKLFGLGKVEFTIANGAIDNVPHLKYL